MWLSMEHRQDFQPRSPFFALGQLPSCSENTAQRHWAETRYSLRRASHQSASDLVAHAAFAGGVGVGRR